MVKNDEQVRINSFANLQFTGGRMFNPGGQDECCRPSPSFENTVDQIQYAVREYAKIIVKRDSGSKGALCTSRLSVDGEPVADIKTSEKVELNLPYGEHILSVDLQGMSIMCGKMNTEREIMVSKDKQDEYRIGVTVSAELFIMKTAYK